MEDDRQIKHNDSTFDDFSNTIYLGDNDSIGANDTITKEWSGNVTDQYYTEYNFFDADPGAVSMTFATSGQSYTGKSNMTMKALEERSTYKTNNGYTSGIAIKKKDLLNYMKTNGIFKVTVSATIDYEYNYDQVDWQKRTLTIYRTAFNLGKPTVITKPYTPQRDNNFFNDTYTSFEIQIPVVDQDNYNASTIASSIASNIKNGSVSAKVYYGKGANEYITASASSSGANLKLKCSLPADFANTDGTGITVKLENMKAAYNGREYRLDTANNMYSAYISTHKVDTKGTTVTVNSDDLKKFDEYAAQHTFRLNVDGNEMLYIENSDGTRSQGYFSYRLLDGKTVKELKNYKTTPTTRVPYASNAIYTVEPTEKLEGSYELQITTRDFANNKETFTYMSTSFFIKQGFGDGFPNKQNLLDMQPIRLKSSRFRFVLSQDPLAN